MFGGRKHTERLEQILAGLITLGEKVLDGQFTVISQGGIRQRPMQMHHE